FPRDKIIFQSSASAVKALEDEGKLWREAEIKVHIGDPAVNEETKRVYICPFTGKVFGDNTHPNPQDAIYDWVSTCPENTERVDGLRVKRFFVSDDLEVIGNYIAKAKPQKTITKKVFSSALSGKLFNSKQAVVSDFKNNYLKPLTLVEVQSQNRFKIEDAFLTFLQDKLEADKIAGWVEAMAEIEEFLPFVEKWIEASEEAEAAE
ncbi:MAG: DUF2709 domain-containing protein, partial [Chlamydiia bacterium]|nr:DUF2709 domain-containing protein [Chlamydiia bacterium]